ncbi:MAG: D-lactate dehydrogenase VanH-A [Spirochaetaceae bacterium]|jgi:D-lactate dehydrogenase|nr:D-lactate dehydrogenase VanH-A [Spirochaetaceae bacterium]
MKIVIYTERDDEALYFTRFAPLYGVELLERREDPSVETARFAEGISAVSVITTPMTAPTLEALYARGVRFISTRSIGLDHFDLAAARRLGLRIGNVSYDPDAVSNYTIMLILMAIRRIKNISRLADAGDFSLRAGVQGRNLKNLTVGIVGTGRIGCRVIEHLAGFGCTIAAFSRSRNEAASRYARYVDWEELLALSDIISLHLHPSPETFHLINSDTISRMKDGVVIVNTARGGLIDSEALIAGVESGKVGAAALDVHEDELGLYYKDLRGRPLANRSLAVLRSFPNVIVTPHTAFYTDQTVSDMAENTIRSCLNFERGLDNPWEINL